MFPVTVMRSFQIRLARKPTCSNSSKDYILTYTSSYLYTKASPKCIQKTFMASLEALTSFFRIQKRMQQSLPKTFID